MSSIYHHSRYSQDVWASVSPSKRLEIPIIIIILWRNSADENIATYRLRTVTYGIAPAAFLAKRSMTQVRLDEHEHFPISSFPVNLMTGAESLEDLSVLKSETTNLLERGGFILRKRYFNTKIILQNTSPEDRESLQQ